MVPDLRVDPKPSLLGGTAVEARLPEQVGIASRIAALDAAAFERLTKEPDFPDAEERAVREATVRLDAYAVARIMTG